MVPGQGDEVAKCGRLPDEQRSSHANRLYVWQQQRQRQLQEQQWQQQVTETTAMAAAKALPSRRNRRACQAGGVSPATTSALKWSASCSGRLDSTGKGSYRNFL